MRISRIIRGASVIRDGVLIEMDIQVSGEPAMVGTPWALWLGIRRSLLQRRAESEFVFGHAAGDSFQVCHPIGA